VTFFDDLGTAVGNAFCTWLGGVGNAEAWLQRKAGLNPGGVGAGIRGALCNDPTPPPSTPPPFQGGQCPNVAYDVSYGWSFPGETPQSFTTTYTGPIGLDVGSEDLGGGLTRYFGAIVFRAGQFNEGRDFAYQTTSEPENPLSITNIVRTDGQPDTCGDPEPIIPEFEPPDLTIIVPDPDGGPDIDLDLTIYAPVIVGGNVFAPITINGPDINLNGEISLNPDFNISIGSGIGGGSSSGGGGTGVLPEPTDIDEDSPDEPDACDGREILGLHVTLVFGEGSRATDVSQDGDIGAIGVPRVATLYFVARMGGSTNLLPGIDLKQRSQYVPVPPNVFVDCWRFNLEQGISLASVRPVFKTPVPESSE